MSRVMIAMVINLMLLSFDDIPEDVVRTLEVGGAVDHMGHSSLLQQGADITGGIYRKIDSEKHLDSLLQVSEAL